MTTVPANSPSQPINHTLGLIRALGRVLDDLERERIMATNRIGALEREYGEALPHLYYIVEPMEQAEHRAELELVRAWRRHALAPWAKSVMGCGEKSIARLIAETGEPADRPNVAKFWAYCGHGDPARRRRKGMSQEELFRLGSPEAKKRAYLIGSGFVRLDGEPDKNGRSRGRSPYRDLYDEVKARYADRLHETTCAPCGPSGKPAAPGSPWSDQHKHKAAIRFITKRFLRDLWVAARDVRA